MAITINCPWCKKDIDIMQTQMDQDLRYVLDALPSFGARYSALVMGYACLFGVTPMAIKSKKLRIIIEEMKRLFDAQAFTWQKKTYHISHAGIGEALDLCVKKDFSAHLENHNYLKRVMITIAEREEKDGVRQAEAALKAREDTQRAHGKRQDASEPHLSPEARRQNLQKLGDIIKSLG